MRNYRLAQIGKVGFYLRAPLAGMVLLAPPVFAKSLQCKGVLDQTASSYVYQVRGVLDEKVEFKDDLSFLSAMQKQEQLGVVGTYFSKEWDTQVYYTQTGIPKNGKTPLVDPDSRAVYIFFHGSGTQKSSGRNFIANMNTLSRLGYSAIAIDMPFHAEGPRGEKYKKSSEFMEWVKNIVTEAKRSGKAVYLAGHSFGPDVILEFISRYPKLADGVVGLSPASFTKELDRWYQNYTTKMKFGGDVPENVQGGEWAYLMSKQFAWSKQKLADPTKVNPDLKVRILSGDREEYVPAPLEKDTYAVVGQNTYDVSVPLRKLFSGATITIEPGIGHYLFDHVDAAGTNVVLRELLAVDGQVANKDFLKNRAYEVSNERKKVTEAVAMAKKYQQDQLFRSWVDQKYGAERVQIFISRGNEALAQKIATEYETDLLGRMSSIYKRILETKNTHPEFYAKYKDMIDRASPNKLDQTLFYPYLQNVLKTRTVQDASL